MSTLIGFRQLIKFTATHRRFSAGVRMRLMKSLDEDTGLEIRYESAIKKLLDISGPETIFWTTSYSRHPIYLLYFPMVVPKS